MDAVRAFNNELSSLYESKPPVSRAKMGAVTKAAIKAIKFYKHVVQSVEKFVFKCKPEYKIPGLYVIDSIVRQSRHQFGGDKDVFGPRFTKNIIPTFQSLLKCSAEDRSRVIRVLNLWQKNTVFPIELIQALVDMASDPTNPDCVATAQRISDNVVLAHQRSLGKMPSTGDAPTSVSAPSTGIASAPMSVPAAAPAPAPAPAPVGASNGGAEESLISQQSDIVNTVTKLLQQTGEGNLLTSGQDSQLQQLQLLQQQLMMHTELMSHKPQQAPRMIDGNLLAQIKLLTDQLLSKTEPPAPAPAPAAAPTPPALPPPPPPLPAVSEAPVADMRGPVNTGFNPDSRGMSSAGFVPVGDMRGGGNVGFAPVGESRNMTSSGFVPVNDARGMSSGGFVPVDARNMSGMPHGVLAHLRQENEAMLEAPAPREMPAEPIFNKKLLDFDYGDSDEEEMEHKMNIDVSQPPPSQPPPQQQQLPGDVHKLLSDPSMMQHIHNVSSLRSEQLHHDIPDPEAARKQHLEQQQEQFNKEIEQASSQNQYSSHSQDQDVIVVEDNDDRDSRDYDRDRRRSRHSRDRSRSPKRRRYSRSRSRERRRSRDRHRRSRSREYDREKRERDRERKKKGLPPLKDKHVSLCSTTLWFGHLAKYTTENELRSEIEEFGATESIKMVPPRGCAFVNMAVRKEAAKALDKMKGLKLNSSALRVAWAINMGAKESAFKDLWDVDLGVTYIPWDKLPADLSPLLDGAMIDEDSLPEHLKGTLDDLPLKAGNGGQSNNNAPPNFGPNNQSIPSSQGMGMMPSSMMIPPPGSLPPGMPLMPPTTGQLPPGSIPLPGQNNPPPGLPPSLLPPHPGSVSSPIPLPVGLMRPPMEGALHSTSSVLMPGQQPGILARPGFPPGPPFGRPPPNMPLGMRPPLSMEEVKEWPSDAELEDTAMAEMDDGGESPGRSNPMPSPLMPMPVMRMGMPGPPPPMQMLGPRLLQPAGPPDGPEGMMHPQMPPGLLGPGPIGLRLGPPGFPPGNFPFGNRLGVPGIRGMGPGGSPIRIVLGQRPNLVRPGGPFRLDNPRQPMGERPPSPGRLGPGSIPSLMSLRGGPPGLGPRPGMPVNGGFPPGAGGPPPVMNSGPTNDNADASPQYDDDDKSPAYGEESSPEYGDDSDVMGDISLAAQDNKVCGGDPHSGPPKEHFQNNMEANTGPILTKSGRLSRWDSRANDDKSGSQDDLTGANGLPSSTRVDPKLTPTLDDPPMSEGLSEG